MPAPLCLGRSLGFDCERLSEAAHVGFRSAKRAKASALPSSRDTSFLQPCAGDLGERCAKVAASPQASFELEHMPARSSARETRTEKCDCFVILGCLSTTVQVSRCFEAPPSRGRDRKKHGGGSWARSGTRVGRRGRASATPQPSAPPHRATFTQQTQIRFLASDEDGVLAAAVGYGRGGLCSPHRRVVQPSDRRAQTRR